MLGKLVARRPSHTTVVAYVALFFAMGGTAYAVNEWTGANVVDGSLTNADLAAETIRSGKIKNGNVATQDLAVDSVTASKIADNSIDSGEIVNGSLLAVDLAAGSVGTSEVIDNSITGADVANGQLTMADLRGADNNGTISLVAGAVSNGTCEDFEAIIPGSQEGDAVLLSLRGSVADGMVLMGVGVAVDGQATLKVCNFTGGASPAISNLPIRLFTFD